MGIPSTKTPLTRSYGILEGLFLSNAEDPHATRCCSLFPKVSYHLDLLGQGGWKQLKKRHIPPNFHGFFMVFRINPMGWNQTRKKSTSIK